MELRRTNEELTRKIAERNRLQEANRQQELQLIQANKMSALGILASGVAHEINNPNQLVLTNARVLTKSLGGRSRDFGQVSARKRRIYARAFVVR